MARVSAPRLEELVREAEVLSTLKASVPYAWKILEHEIGLARLAAEADRAPGTPRAALVRKRVKLRVPAEQYPDYNFVGRLLGPRGATLKKLERDTSCRIMIRGKGSIRKDKEAEVRGKPGWEHVFNEALHVVIEVADTPDDAAAARTLARAKELVELLLVPVPEERDSLKRAQLRDLAILNGTHRAPPRESYPPPHDAYPPPAASPPPPAASPTAAASPPPPPRRPLAPLYTPPASSADFLAPFDASFAPRQARPSPRASPPPASSAVTSAAPSQPASARDPAYLPDLESLRIPSLDFDHLSESALTLHTFGGIPAASPTIVDPDIYPYPPTPGLLPVDPHLHLNTFASPVWTPSRNHASGPGAAGSAIPPPSPQHDASLSSSSSFLLGRALADPPAPTSASAGFARPPTSPPPLDPAPRRPRDRSFHLPDEPTRDDCVLSSFFPPTASPTHPGSNMPSDQTRNDHFELRHTTPALHDPSLSQDPPFLAQRPQFLTPRRDDTPHELSNRHRQEEARARGQLQRSRSADPHSFMQRLQVDERRSQLPLQRPEASHPQVSLQRQFQEESFQKATPAASLTKNAISQPPERCEPSPQIHDQAPQLLDRRHSSASSSTSTHHVHQ